MSSETPHVGFEEQHQRAQEIVQFHRDRLRKLLEHYKAVFGNQNYEAGQAVLEDLRLLCFADRNTIPSAKDATGRIDPIAMGVNEGMRQVYNYIRARVVVASDPDRIERLLKLEIKNPLEEDEE